MVVVWTTQEVKSTINDRLDKDGGEGNGNSQRIRHYLETEHTVLDIYSLEGPMPSACQLGLAFALQVGE